MNEFIMLVLSWTMVLVIIFAAIGAVCSIVTFFEEDDASWSLLGAVVAQIWIAMAAGCWLEVYGTI